MLPAPATAPPRATPAASAESVLELPTGRDVCTVASHGVYDCVCVPWDSNA